MLELILSSGYHGVLSCTRDIRYPYRKKKDLFLELSIKLHTFIMGGFRGGPRGPHLLFFKVKFCFVLWGIFIKIKWFLNIATAGKFPSRPRLPFLNFLDLPLFVWATFDFNFSQRFIVNCQNLCCQSRDSQSSVAFSPGSICLHHLTIENEIRWKFCRIFTLATSGNGRMDISAVFSSQVWP